MAASIRSRNAHSLNRVKAAQFVRADQETQFDVGRGVVHVENNADDNADGAGITFRAYTNPANGSPNDANPPGSILAVRSSGQALRLWVGQSVTSTGANDLETVNLRAAGNIDGNLDASQLNRGTIASQRLPNGGVWASHLGNGSNEANWVRDRIATTGPGNVGAYALLYNASGETDWVGRNVSGNGHFYASTTVQTTNNSPAGTWRCMGYVNTSQIGVYLRIS